MRLNPFIERVANVGGVGYLGSADAHLDDAVIPAYYAATPRASNSSFRQINGHERRQPAALHFDVPTVHGGVLHSVIPTLGKLSNSKELEGTPVDMIDMEVGGLLAALRQREDIRHAAYHYIMDLPRRGSSLGDTYYHRPYLEQLFSRFPRGKYACFERALHFLT